ncbi:MAG: RsmE family RNA methyltransferase [Planctomycetes bacterium]|jgi:16S rRNA (uracil1498-N3)-methyltransferase|nr:RsmE family RNA methyltransferase [Planctomycetota bacterium]MBT4028126.1 RsmE family RNA methyltransferase [Planctomycetota bacterium]MBT4560749.1 RsmE family RNA methyltransferase [Planctomycetota bacterium]MBT5101805.1 RsmE family RNA methyltransferase [Planctomycetota bacterium]MBT5121086.1 RsmE family RNA methyltransferase [Planctomycetota bacterium]
MRFFLLDSLPDCAPGPWLPPRGLAAHMKALRLAAGEAFLLLTDDSCRVAHWSGSEITIGAHAPRPTLNLRPVTLATAWPKGARADELITRIAEAGVMTVQPLVCERSVSGRKPLPDNKLKRFNRRMREVCQQCRNPHAPELMSQPISAIEAIQERKDALALLLQPGARPLIEVLSRELPTADGHQREILLLVGPEGGFSQQEETDLLAAGAVATGLLPTVLRIEAAGPLAAALCQHDR